MGAYPHLTPIDIRFRDIDALGHVNNAVFSSYMENARIAFFKDHFSSGPSWLDIGLILARVEIDFLAPVLLTDQLTVETVIEKVGSKSFTFTYRFLEPEKGTLFAKARTVVVCFDYEKGATREIPEEWRTNMERLANQP